MSDTHHKHDRGFHTPLSDNVPPVRTLNSDEKHILDLFAEIDVIMEHVKNRHENAFGEHGYKLEMYNAFYKAQVHIDHSRFLFTEFIDHIREWRE